MAGVEVLEYLPMVGQAVRRLPGHLRRRLGGWQDAMATGCLLLLREARRYDPACGWAFSTALHTRLRFGLIRAAGRSALVPRPEGRPDLPVMRLHCRLPVIGQDGPREEWLASVRWAISEALESLTPAQRRAVRMHYLEGLTMPEAAERLGVTWEAVKVRLYEAKRRLRDSVLRDYAEALA